MPRLTSSIANELRNLLQTDYPDFIYVEYNPKAKEIQRPFIGVQYLRSAQSNVSKTISNPLIEHTLSIVIGVAGESPEVTEQKIEEISKKIISHFKPYRLLDTDKNLMVVDCYSDIQPENISRLRDTFTITLRIVALSD